MKTTIMFFSVFFLLFTSVVCHAEEAALEEPAGEIELAAPDAVISDVIVLEDGTEEVLFSSPAEEGAPMNVDDRIQAIETEKQEKISAIVQEINMLADKSDEGELQKEIEGVKLDAEIARLNVYLEDAENAQDSDLASEIRDEIEHLENLDQPAIGIPEERPAP